MKVADKGSLPGDRAPLDAVNPPTQHYGLLTKNH
jgi:hypothetical protein